MEQKLAFALSQIKPPHNMRSTLERWMAFCPLLLSDVEPEQTATANLAKFFQT